MKKIKENIIAIVAVTCVIAVVAWKLSSNKQAMEKDAVVASIKTSVFPVSITQPKLEDLVYMVSENGVFNPLRQLNYVSETSGKVVSLHVKKGQYVKSGSVLAQLENKQILIDLDQAQKTLLKNQADMDKFKTMLVQNAVNAQQVEDQKLVIINATSRIATLKRQLATSTILAPFSGYINELKIEVGSYLSPGSAIAEIVDVSSLKMKIMLMDKTVLKIRNGQKVSVRADLYPDSEFRGIISAIASVGDDTRKFGVEITLPNDEKKPLKAGMTGTAFINFGENKKALFIPSTCVVGSMQDAKVYVVTGNTVSLRPITIGDFQGENVEVIKGLSNVDKVVVSGQLNIADGSVVSIINQ